MSDLAEARAELRSRLGVGARYDDPAAPARELTWARSGTAYFARKLNELDDVELSAPALGSGRSRRHVVAEISYQARALAELAEGARKGVRELEGDPFARIAEVILATTLPARALRNLFRHSEVHLNVEWRDLNAPAWSAVLRLRDGQEISMRDMVWVRTRSIWLSSVDLDNGGAFVDFPPGLIDTLLAEAAADLGQTHAMILNPTDRPEPLKLGSACGPTISGTAADLARWITGRGAMRLTSPAGLPCLPHGTWPSGTFQA